MAEKTRYTDVELAEFKQIIIDKKTKAKHDLDILKNAINHKDDNDTYDTYPTFKVMEEGANVYSKEQAGRLAQRQEKFIRHLEEGDNPNSANIFI